MHNKMMIADGAFAIAGGRNIADEYFFSSKVGNFLDFDLLVSGAAVPKLQGIFDIYWNSPRVYPLAQFEATSADPATRQQAFEQLTADANSAFPTPPADQPDLLGYLPLSVGHYSRAAQTAARPDRGLCRQPRKSIRTR